MVGETDDEVKMLQSILNIDKSGDFDNQTEDCVKDFQDFTNIKVDDMLKATNNDVLLFETINEQEIELTIEEVPEDKDNEVKNWRIQLDVKTSLKNLKKIEVFIKENIQEML